MRKTYIISHHRQTSQTGLKVDLSQNYSCNQCEKIVKEEETPEDLLTVDGW